MRTQTRPFEKELMEQLCRYIEAHSDDTLNLETLAKQAHLSPSHLQRRFKAVIGVSPKEYAEACRLRRLKQKLAASSRVTDAIYDAGFASSSRVYERIDHRLGMTPKQYRRQGCDIEISYAFSATPLGKMMIGATDRGICFLQFGDRRDPLVEQLRIEYAQATITPMPERHRTQFNAWMETLNRFLENGGPAPDLPLDIRGTAFQIKVWKYLQTIPAGTTQSYREVAEAIGQPKAARAVGSACARNRIAIIIPCHRVLRGSGNLSGYRWGLQRKERLLKLEKSEKKSGRR